MSFSNSIKNGLALLFVKSAMVAPLLIRRNRLGLLVSCIEFSSIYTINAEFRACQISTVLHLWPHVCVPSAMLNQIFEPRNIVLHKYQDRWRYLFCDHCFRYLPIPTKRVFGISKNHPSFGFENCKHTLLALINACTYSTAKASNGFPQQRNRR